MSTLIVALPTAAADAPASWAWALTPDGQLLADQGHAGTALLPRADELVLMVPCRALSWHRIDLPRAPAKRLRAALDGVLEEQLLDEPATLHLALQPGARAGEPAWVAACDKAWLQAALAQFEAQRRPVMRIVPELAPAPGPAQAWVTGDPAQPWVLKADDQGVLSLPLAALADIGQDQPALDWQADPAVAALAEQALGRKVHVLHPAERMLAAARSAWDLAQFDLQHSGQARRLRGLQRHWRSLLDSPAWRPVRVALLLLLLVNLAGLNAWAWKEGQALTAKRTEIRGLLERSFPAVKVIVDAPLQMAREVAQLQRGSGQASDQDLETLLAALAPLLPAGRSASGLDFSPGELSLAGLGLAPAELAELQGRLQPLGYQASESGQRLIVRASGSRP